MQPAQGHNQRKTDARMPRKENPATVKQMPNKTKRSPKQTIDQYFQGNEKKIQLVYLIKSLFLDRLLQYPEEALRGSPQDIRNTASALFFVALEHAGLAILYQIVFQKKEKVYILKQCREQAVEFVTERENPHTEKHDADKTTHNTECHAALE
jgi:hypothetical protein